MFLFLDLIEAHSNRRANVVEKNSVYSRQKKYVQPKTIESS